jgi:hypothetical protein
MLKDIEFPIVKHRIIERVKEYHSDSLEKQEILEKLDKIVDRERI